MNKRRLSKQQQSRIDANQRKRLAEDSASDSTTYNNCNGRVISHFGQQLDVESLEPETSGEIIRCHQRTNLPDLVTGDYVVWEKETESTGIILALGERKNLFSRPGFAGKLKPVAANLDVVVIVIAAAPQAFMNLIDRYLVAVSAIGLESILVLNKTDLIDDGNKLDLQALLSVYRDLNYPVLSVSAKQGEGMDELNKLLEGKTTVLVGQSGVGKSSLINRLGGEVLAEIGELSTAHAKGTHTTTTARLFHLGDFDLIDSPGIREFELGHIEAEQIVLGFPEIALHAENCKFRDCKHGGEPGCRVRDAVAEGLIHPDRMQSYQQIVRSITSD